MALMAGHVLADKGYDGQRAMDAIAASDAKPIVPPRTTTASWRSFDPAIYKNCNLIERFFRKIKHSRRIATRHAPRATTNSPETMLASSTSSLHSNVADNVNTA